MGIKLLNLKMIPWRFHVMGNTTCHPSDGPPRSPSATKSGRPAGGGKAAPRCIKLIRADGRVEVYHRPVTASELMEEHPKHLVCRSDAFTIGQLIPALPAGEQLQPDHAYFLLPVHFFQSVLSFVTLASSFATAAKGGPSLLRRPFEVHKTPSGKLQIRISDECIQRMQEAQEEGNGRGEEGGGGGGRVCTTATLEKDYQQLVVGSRKRQWKPKLETIRESEKRKGKLVAVGGRALRGIPRRRKKGHQVEPQSHELKQQVQQKQQQKRQKKEKKKKGHQVEPHGLEQKQQPQQKPQKKQKQKVSVVAKHQNSPTSSKSKGKIMVAYHF